MTSIIFSLFTLFVFFFHMYAGHYVRLNRIKEALCATWLMDMVLTICGIVISFHIYQYSFAAFFSFRNIALVLTYMLITFLFLLLAPTGLHLLTFQKQLSTEELLCAEYRFNATLCLVRNFLYCLLLLVPLIKHLPVTLQEYQTFLSALENSQISSGFYFTVFLLLLPVTLRQTLYWIKSLKQEPTETEIKLMKHYCLPFHYHHRNFFV